MARARDGGRRPQGSAGDGERRWRASQREPVTHPAGVRVDTDHGVLAGVGHPDRAQSGSDRDRASADGHGVAHRVGLRVDPRHGPVVAVGHPHAAVADGDPRRPAADPDRLQGRARSGVELGHDAVLLAGHPHRPGTRGDGGGPAGDVDPVDPAGVGEVEAVDLPVDRRREPDRAARDGDPARAVARGQPVHHPVRARVDLRDPPVLTVGDPQRAVAERDRGRLAADIDRRDPAVVPVEPRHRAVGRARDPHRAGSGHRGAGAAADRELRRDPIAGRVDQPDRVLTDPRQPFRLEDPDDAERGHTGDHEGGRERQEPPLPNPASGRGSGRRLRLRGRRDLECRVLREDRVLQPPQLRARLDADLLDELGPRVAEGGERLGLATRAIQREHVLRAQVLTQRMGGDHPLELTEDLDVASGRQVAVDRALGRAQAQLVEAADLGRGERLVGDVGQRVAAPEGQRRTRLRSLDEALEAERVHLAVRELELIAAPAREDPRAVFLEHPPQPRYVELDHLGSAGRRLLSPQSLGQTIGRDRAPELQREHRKNRPLLAGAQLDGPALEASLKRPQQLQIHLLTTLLGSARRVVEV